MRIRPFQHVSSGAVSFGPGIAASVGGQGPLKKAKKIVVVTDAGVVAAGIVAKVLPSLGDRLAFVDDGCVPDADVKHINALGARLKDSGVDAILAVGGGSVIDTAKCAAAVLAKGAPIQSLEGIATVRTKLVPLVCIPTTAGTGSEATQFAVVKDREAGKKCILMDLSLLPVLSLLDPELIRGLPAAVTAATGVDAVTHAIEAMASRMGNPIATALAVDAVRILQGALPRSLEAPDDIVARSECLVAANMAGQAISSAMLGACHAFAHALGALKGVPHGVANGVFLVPVMKLNTGPAYAYLGYCLGAREEPAAFAIDAVDKLVHGVAKIPTSLRALGVVDGDVDALVKLTMADADLATNPVTLDEAAVRRVILERM